MRFLHSIRWFIALGIAGLMPPALVQAADVPYVPTPQVVVDAMLKIANVGPNDYLIDLGSGDRKSTRLNSSHIPLSRMPSSA